MQLIEVVPRVFRVSTNTLLSELGHVVDQGVEKSDCHADEQWSFDGDVPVKKYLVNENGEEKQVCSVESEAYVVNLFRIIFPLKVNQVI